MDNSSARIDEHGRPGAFLPLADLEGIDSMVGEYGFGSSMWVVRNGSWAAAVLNILFFALAGWGTAESGWRLFLYGVLCLPLTWSSRHFLRLMSERRVVVSSVGLRYEHLPETEVVPWSEFRGARLALGGIELLDARGAVRFVLLYGLERFHELHRLVLKPESIASPRPVRFRRSKLEDVVLCACMVSLLGAGAYVDWTWAFFPVVGMVLVSLYMQIRSPYAVEVTPEHVILSFLFRTLRIPLHGIQFAHHRRHGEEFYVVDPVAERRIGLRRVGVSPILLEATVRAAIERLHPARGPWR